MIRWAAAVRQILCQNIEVGFKRLNLFLQNIIAGLDNMPGQATDMFTPKIALLRKIQPVNFDLAGPIDGFWRCACRDLKHTRLTLNLLHGKTFEFDNIVNMDDTVTVPFIQWTQY